jgi:peptide-methionine (S)-S-oxide reductase
MVFGWNNPAMVAPEDALPGRHTPMPVAAAHRVLGTPMTPPFPDGTETIVLGMGCFWGAERRFWELPGVHTTAVGYSGGHTPNPTYEEVCSGRTGHAEVVLVVFEQTVVGRERVLRCFWEGHDPTQGFRQGNDVGTQYRSAIYAISDEQLADARAGRDRFGAVLRSAHFGPITTEIAPAGPFFYAEDRHQQYLAVHPDGYCGLGGTGLVLGDPGSRRPGEGPTP